MLWVPLNIGMSAAHCQGNAREFQSVWRVVTLYQVINESKSVSYLIIDHVRLQPFYGFIVIILSMW